MNIEVRPTADFDTNKSICAKQNMPTPSVLNSRKGINGLFATKPSVKMKPTPNNAHETANTTTMGWLHGSLCPPRFRTNRKLVVAAANKAVPTKSRLRTPEEPLRFV